APNDPNGSLLPRQGEKLQLNNINQSGNERVAKALKRLAEDKAPEAVATLVMWNVSGGMDWDRIAGASEGGANAHERSLARAFVPRREKLAKEEPGSCVYEVRGSGATTDALAGELSTLLKDITVLGLKSKASVPDKPEGPAVACRIVVSGDAKPEATV